MKIEQSNKAPRDSKPNEAKPHHSELSTEGLSLANRVEAVASSLRKILDTQR